jgi:bacterioferritin-associated ferredoxin
LGCIEILYAGRIALESWMIVCSCNVLTDADIRASIATLDGPRRVCDVYASLGCAPKCGGCAATISVLISETEGRDLGAERTRRGGEARGRIDVPGCEGHRLSQSGLQKRVDCNQPVLTALPYSGQLGLQRTRQDLAKGVDRGDEARGYAEGAHPLSRRPPQHAVESR